MDEKAKFALKRDIERSFGPGARQLTSVERIWHAWRFTQGRRISVSEMMGELSPEASRALAEEARHKLEGHEQDADDPDLGLFVGTLPTPYEFDSSNPNFIPFAFLRELGAHSA